MKIYIDESGSFAMPSSGQSISLVGALVLPEISLSRIENKYNKLRPSLPMERGEVKGKLLSESQVAAVVGILARNEVLFETTAMVLISDDTTLRAHRAGQCEEMTMHVTSAHQPSMIEGVWKLRARLAEMSLPLYAQSLATYDLVWTTFKHSTMYFSQRRPQSLGHFEWVIDGKAAVGVTDAEDWWRSVIYPHLLPPRFASHFR